LVLSAGVAAAEPTKLNLDFSEVPSGEDILEDSIFILLAKFTPAI
jgi:hypothetical protein